MPEAGEDIDDRRGPPRPTLGAPRGRRGRSAHGRRRSRADPACLLRDGARPLAPHPGGATVPADRRRVGASPSGLPANLRGLAIHWRRDRKRSRQRRRAGGSSVQGTILSTANRSPWHRAAVHDASRPCANGGGARDLLLGPRPRQQEGACAGRNAGLPITAGVAAAGKPRHFRTLLQPARPHRRRSMRNSTTRDWPTRESWHAS